MSDDLRCLECGAELTTAEKHKVGSGYLCDTDYWAALRNGRLEKYGASVQSGGGATTGARPVLKQRYGATRLVIGFIRILTLLVWVGVVYGFSQLNAYRGAFEPPLPYNGFMLIVTAVGGIFMLAAAEGLQVVLDMEEHQRAMRLSLERQEQRNV